MFPRNESTLDRVLRIVLGVVLLAAFFYYPESSLRWWALIGIVPLVTGLVGSCPIYRILGISSCPIKRT